MSDLTCIRFLLFSLLVTNCISVDSAFAAQVSYSYEGNNFVEVEGDPELFSTSDRVSASFTVDCAAAHPEGDCRNLPYQDYFERGAVDTTTLIFSAGPVTLPTPSGGINVNRFLLSTDDNAQIVDWDMDLYSDEVSPVLNVDTDNVGTGLDSAAAPGGGAVVEGNPGSWTNGPLIPVDDFDIAVSKRVSNPVPSDPMQTVEFTIEVSNLGRAMATGVVVKDSLPPSLEIPDGMAAFTSVGYYDPSSGLWEIGDMEGSATPAIMTIPAVVATETQPACIVNTASANLPGDTNSSNDTSSVALLRPDIDRCVDLEVEVIISMEEPLACVGSSKLFYDFLVTNNGPDSAYNVVLEVTETLYKTPGFSLNGSSCEGLRCTWESLYSGQSERVSASTDIFRIQVPTEHAIELVVSSDIEDYEPENNTVTDQHTLYPVDKIPCGGGGMDFGGAGGGCFIATATYGTSAHPHVQVLREFRDNVLAKSEWGRELVKFYYRHSPELACRIEDSTSLRLLVRGLLAPVVFVLTYPWAALLLLFALSGLLVYSSKYSRTR